MWMKTTKQCSPIARLVPLIELHQLGNKIKEYQREREAFYQEERELWEGEPEYFPKNKKNIDNTDFAELLPEEYGYSGNGEIINPGETTSEEENNEVHDDTEYPEFPSAKEN